jgi:hypothetical protein
MRPPQAVLVAAVALGTVLAGVPAGASSWVVGLAAGANSEAQARTLPAAPASPAAACVSSSQKQILVTWASVSPVTSYTVYVSTTSSSSGFSVTAGGVVGTSWNSGNLGANNYWFQVAAVLGSNWVGTPSAATGETTIQVGATKCVQP